MTGIGDFCMSRKKSRSSRKIRKYARDNLSQSEWGRAAVVKPLIAPVLCRNSRSERTSPEWDFPNAGIFEPSGFPGRSPVKERTVPRRGIEERVLEALVHADEDVAPWEASACDGDVLEIDGVVLPPNTGKPRTTTLPTSLS